MVIEMDSLANDNNWQWKSIIIFMAFWTGRLKWVRVQPFKHKLLSWILGCLTFRVGMRYMVALILLHRLPGLPHICDEHLEVPTENQRFDFLTQTEALSRAMSEILMKLAILQATLHVKVHAHGPGWVKQGAISNLVEDLFQRVVQSMTRFILRFF